MGVGERRGEKEGCWKEEKNEGCWKEGEKNEGVLVKEEREKMRVLERRGERIWGLVKEGRK